MYHPTSDIDSIFKIAQSLEKSSQHNKEYRAKLFREIHSESTETKDKDGNPLILPLTPQEIIGKLIELCMEADYLRRLPPNLINELSDIIEGIQILEESGEDLTELIDLRKGRFRKLVRYIANVAYAKPNPPALDLHDLALLSQNKKREVFV